MATPVKIGVRLSVFDFVPYKTSRETGEPMEFASIFPYEYGFGADPDNPLQYDLTEPIELMRRLAAQLPESLGFSYSGSK